MCIVYTFQFIIVPIVYWVVKEIFNVSIYLFVSAYTSMNHAAERNDGAVGSALGFWKWIEAPEIEARS